jgi:DNA-binding NarL/FixJ family response regulator
VILVVVAASTLAERIGLISLIDDSDRLQVIAEATSLDNLEDLPLDTDVIVATSVSIPHVQVQAPLEDPKPYPAILLLSDDPDETKALRRLSIRAWGALSPDASQEELVAAVSAVHEGLVVTPPEYFTKIANNSSMLTEVGEDGLIETLTPRELEVLQELAMGLANKQIALALDISEHTVKFHISSIYGKLGATNRTEAVRLGLQYGMIIL